ncbi:hypothetical protein ACJX0J_007702 [Zea mays]
MVIYVPNKINLWDIIDVYISFELIACALLLPDAKYCNDLHLKIYYNFNCLNLHFFTKRIICTSKYQAVLFFRPMEFISSRTFHPDTADATHPFHFPTEFAPRLVLMGKIEESYLHSAGLQELEILGGNANHIGSITHFELGRIFFMDMYTTSVNFNFFSNVVDANTSIA